MKYVSNLLSSQIFYSFSQIKVRNNQGGYKVNKNNQNIQINHKIVDSREIPDLLKLHESQHEMFNFVNYATLYKKITQISRDRVDETFLTKINSGLYQKLIGQDEWKQGESISRAIAQLGFYFAKLLENQQYRHHSNSDQVQQTESNKELTNYETDIEAIQNILDEQGVKLFHLMNDQEKSNFLYQLGKRGKVELIEKIAKDIEIVIHPTTELKTLLSIMYSLTISGFECPEIILKIDGILTRVLSKHEAINYMSCRDLSDILFCYSKNQYLLEDSQIFTLIENAAALPFSQNPNDNVVTQKRVGGYNNKYNNNQQGNSMMGNWVTREREVEKRKIASLFRNEIEIDTLSISSMFNSIANFSQNKFSYDFYERFENIIILLRFKNTRQLANTFRGIALYYTPSEPLFNHIEKQALQFLQKGLFEKDLMSFSTILYFMALHSKGSLNFYQNAEMFTINHLQSFNMRQLNFIFFSFKFSLHYHLERKNKDLIIDYIVSIFPNFTPDEMASIILNFHEFEEEGQRKEIFFETTAKIIENQKFKEDNNENQLTLIFFWSIFTAFKNNHPSTDIQKVFPKFIQTFNSYLEKLSTEEQHLKNSKIIQSSHIEDLKQIFANNEQIIYKLNNISQ